ncbi:DsrH/TusB family sulfur metabolism protein [Pseudoalteromonas xiamenensis]
MMNTLYIFTSAELKSHQLAMLTDNDSVLLTQDASYCVSRFVDLKGDKYLLDSCAQARDVKAPAPFKMVTDEEFVALVLSHKTNITW